MTIRNRKDLILWRHAEAQDIQLVDDDLSRALTKKGKSQAASMANWLKQHLPKGTCIMSSAALRAEQTAQALALPYHIHNSLLPQASVDEVLQLVQETFYQSNISDILLIGHQPWLGQVAAYFLQINPAELSIKKSAVWWLTQNLNQQHKIDDEQDEKFKLVAVQSPQFILY